ncbi:hypothetical protein B0A48_09843 [Cryoendolithus antarcticus]|uniref:Uncharacterized protein n=1 Tax=Cryoendolithus antarcticus TaxID=1507870 RepID=A0A1V8T350_9PEZI|nr:hypothetical protein B0A48_09843 [Cryoendolithus antarcticus]
MLKATFLFVAALYGVHAATLDSTKSTSTSGYTKYSTVTGYFLQDDASTNASTFDYTATNFGLKSNFTGGSCGNLTDWQRFASVVNSLNANAPLNTVYKVFWLGRHGEGFHNAAETYYGTPAWNCWWSELTGNATVSWEDADLTAPGIKQAQIANAFWKSEIAVQKTPYPQSYYTSPLTRCTRTANITFSDLALPHYYPFVPTIKEFFREGISTHTCDHRSNKSVIAARFPTYKFEPGFAQVDPYWTGITAEPAPAQDIRSKKALDQVFAQDDHTWISVTSHSGEIASLLRVLGHKTFSLSTGAVIPVLVKGEFLPYSNATSTIAFTTSTYCTNGPPITSSSGVAQGSGEVVLADGTKHYRRRTANSEPSLLILALNQDAKSWSSDFRETTRTANDFMGLLVSTDLNLANVSLALLTSSTSEFEKIRLATDRLPFARVDIYLHSPFSIPGLSYDTRHDPALQLQRRSAIAGLRNYLVSRALRDEKHILWLDVDIVELSTRIVQTMLHHSDSNPEAGIITARCQQHKIENYDKNAWALNRDEKTLLEAIPHGEREAAYTRLEKSRKTIPELIKDSKDDELFPLDSVGATILYLRADLVRQGAFFPTSRIVGATFGAAGWVGLESEGLCYSVKALKGGKCWVLGGRNWVRHSDWA